MSEVEDSKYQLLVVDTMFDSTNIESSILTKDFNKLCRTCLCENKLINIFKSSENKEPKITDLLKELLQLEDINNDNLPQNICTACFQDIHRFFAFKQKCKQNEKALQNVLKVICEQKYDDETKIEPEDVIEEIQITIDPYFSEEDSKPSLPEKTRKTKRRKIFTNPFKFKCRQCFEGFNTMPELKQHKIKNKHIQIGNLKCKVCNKTVTKLNEHMRVHTKEKPYKCEVCQRGFSLHNNLRRHEMSHTGERSFQCKICGKAFTRRYTLTAHLKTHTKIQNARDITKCGNKTKNVEVNSCNICGLSFTLLWRYKNHLKTHSPVSVENKDLQEVEGKTKTGNSICYICSQSFTSKAGLAQHSVTHGDKKFLCGYCGKRFFFSSVLKTHLRVHTREKPYSCSICNKTFAQQGETKIHMLTHTGEKPHSCQFCPKLFKQRSHLREHLKIHTGEKPYSCSFCGKSFAIKCTMRVHERIHTGETPYLCDLCGKGFHDSSSMKSHRRRHGSVQEDSLVISNKTCNTQEK